MNESPGPHGYYDGPIKILAGCHLALIRAIFFLLLVSPTVCLVSTFLYNDLCRISVMRHYPARENGYPSYSREPARDVEERIRAYEYSSDQKFVEARVAGFSVSLWVCQAVSQTALLLAIGFPLAGFCMLVYRFYRLARLLYPQLALYFTMMVLVPFLNLVAILLLLRSALRQMRDRGLRVGMFGIDPARFG